MKIIEQNVFLLSALLFLCVKSGFCQRTPEVFSFRDSLNSVRTHYTLTGVVTDTLGNPLPSVNIYAEGLLTGNSSDQSGKYFLDLQAGEYRLVFRHISMVPKVIRLSLFGNGFVNVKMKEKSLNLEEVIVLSDGIRQNVELPLSGVVTMSMEEMKKLPSLMGENDVVQHLTLLPGVVSQGEGSSGINVRGGRTDQNLMLLNETLVIGSNHAMGFLSSFNSEVVDSYTLYKGSIPSYYGGRSAATLNVNMRKGDFEKWHTALGLGTSSSKILIEGPLQKNRISVLAGLRKSNVNWMLRRVKNEDIQSSVLDFYDVYGVLSWKLNQYNTLSVNLLKTGDYFRLGKTFGFDWSSLLSSIHLKSLLKKNLSISSFYGLGNFKNSFFNPDGADASRLRNGMRYHHGKINALATLGKQAISAGFEGVIYNTEPESVAPYSDQSSSERRAVEKDDGLEFSGFAETELNLSNNVALTAGLRYTIFRQTGPDTVFHYAPGSVKSVSNINDTTTYGRGIVSRYGGPEPRLSLRININELMSFKASYSLLRQYLHTISNTTAPTPLDYWQVSNKHILPQVSGNFSLGVFRNSENQRYSSSIDLFYRQTKNQLEYRNFANLNVNNHLETEIIQANGRSYGAEFLIKKIQGKWTGWVAYTFSRALVKVNSSIPEDRINNGKWFPANYDIPHSMSWVISRKLWPNGSFNFTLNYSTGRPTHAVTGYYDVNQVIIPAYSNRNSYRIPNYFRIDFSATAGSILRKVKDSLIISVYNVTFRRNAYSVYFEKFGGRAQLVPYKVSILGSALPSITYILSF